MIKANNPETKAQVKRRLSRIEGQLRGVQKMIDEDRDCKEIIQQLVAIRAGIHSASLSFMQDVASECLLYRQDQDNPEVGQETLADLIKLMGKLTG